MRLPSFYLRSQCTLGFRELVFHPLGLQLLLIIWNCLQASHSGEVVISFPRIHLQEDAPEESSLGNQVRGNGIVAPIWSLSGRHGPVRGPSFTFRRRQGGNIITWDLRVGVEKDRGGWEWGVWVSAAGHLAFHMDAVILEESRSLNLLLSWELKRALSGLKRT